MKMRLTQIAWKEECIDLVHSGPCTGSVWLNCPLSEIIGIEKKSAIIFFGKQIDRQKIGC